MATFILDCDPSLEMDPDLEIKIQIRRKHKHTPGPKTNIAEGCHSSLDEADASGSIAARQAGKQTPTSEFGVQAIASPSSNPTDPTNPTDRVLQTKSDKAALSLPEAESTTTTQSKIVSRKSIPTEAFANASHNTTVPTQDSPSAPSSPSTKNEQDAVSEVKRPSGERYPRLTPAIGGTESPKDYRSHAQQDKSTALTPAKLNRYASQLPAKKKSALDIPSTPHRQRIVSPTTPTAPKRHPTRRSSATRSAQKSSNSAHITHQIKTDDPNPFEKRDKIPRESLLVDDTMQQWLDQALGSPASADTPNFERLSKAGSLRDHDPFLSRLSSLEATMSPPSSTRLVHLPTFSIYNPDSTLASVARYEDDIAPASESVRSSKMKPGHRTIRSVQSSKVDTETEARSLDPFARRDRIPRTVYLPQE